MSMRVERSTVEDVRERLQLLKRKKVIAGDMIPHDPTIVGDVWISGCSKSSERVLQ